jgi:UDP-N-acetylglucosamine 2-epimerase (non-hydrolysing)
VDDPAVLLPLLEAIHDIACELPVVFSCHPRTASRLDELPAYGALSRRGDLRRLPPLGYLDFLRLTSQSRLVLTDSGGLQEETTWLGIPCVTIRENTERPITISEGTNVLAGTDPDRVRSAARGALATPLGSGRAPALWDGRTAERIVDVFERWWG